ncbi:MAG: YbjN domain-containing protein [Deltaproteobacteria bacterium]|jgi:hypothetical protein|nr:YbjN domain-containing protein [Deltaproteobacteria bacterium]
MKFNLRNVCNKIYFLILIFLALEATNMGSAWALPDSEVQALKRSSSVFRSAENRILKIWNQMPKGLKARVRQEQIRWIQIDRDVQAINLINQGYSKAKAYAIVTDLRSDYLESLMTKPSRAPQYSSPSPNYGSESKYYNILLDNVKNILIYQGFSIIKIRDPNVISFLLSDLSAPPCVIEISNNNTYLTIYCFARGFNGALVFSNNWNINHNSKTFIDHDNDIVLSMFLDLSIGMTSDDIIYWLQDSKKTANTFYSLISSAR